jgi:type IV pilus assembly protein PilM
MAKEVTTLFIRDTSIDVLVMKGMEVKKWASLPLEPGLASQGLIMDEAKVAERLKELFELAKVNAMGVIVGLSGIDSLYRLVSLPELPTAILPEAVKQEAGRIIPVPLDEVYLAYQPLPSSPGETRIFLAAFPRRKADALYRTLRQAGIELRIMDLSPLALCRVANEPRAIIVNSRLDHLGIAVIAGRLPELIRWLSLPGEAMSLDERLPVIVDEVNRAVTFYNSSHKEKPLDSTVPMFVCGDLAEAPQTWQSLAGKLMCPVSVLTAPVIAPKDFNQNEFVVNIGLAFKELLTEKEGANFSIVNINVLPEVYRPKAIRWSGLLAPAAAVICVGLVVYMGFLVRGKVEYNATLRSELASIDSRIDQQLQETVALRMQIEGAKAQVEPMEAKASTFDDKFNELEAGREQMDTELHDIVSLAEAAGIDLDNGFKIDYGGGSVTVSGKKVPDEDDIFKYARALRDKFSTVIISEIKAVEEDEEIIGYDFEFLLK